MGQYKNAGVSSVISSITNDPQPRTEYGVASLSLTNGTLANTQIDVSGTGYFCTIVDAGHGYTADATAKALTGVKSDFTGITGSATGMKVDYTVDGERVVTCKVTTDKTGGSLHSGDRYKVAGRTTGTDDFDCIIEIP